MKTSTAITTSIIGILVLCLGYFLVPKPIPETETVAAANEKEYQKIFERSSDIPQMSEFVELLNPDSALEFYDRETMTNVVEVVMVKQVNDRYKAAIVAPVQIGKTGKYTLTGPPNITIEDSLKEYVRVTSSTRTEGNSISLNPRLWDIFYESGADFEKLRKAYEQREGA